MVFELCSKCESVCNISILKNKVECIKCGTSTPLTDGYVVDDKSYSTSNTSLYDNYKILGVFDPKVTYVEKKCPKCVGKNIHLARLVFASESVILKCKFCDYVETNYS